MDASQKEKCSLNTVAEILKENNFGKIRQWLDEADAKSLDDFISQTATNTDERRYKLGLAERDRRYFSQLKKPHWTLTPSFLVAVFAMVFAAIAAWPVVHEWIQPAAPLSTGSNSQQPQSNLTSILPTIIQTVAPATNAAQSTNLLNK